MDEHQVNYANICKWTLHKDKFN